MSILNQAELILRGIAVPVGEKLTIMRGDTVRMHIAFDYRGPAISNLTLRCSIGKRVLYFDEIAYGQKSVNVAESFDFLPYTAYADIDTSPISPGTDYDIEAKIEEYVDQTLFGIDNMIDVLGAADFAGFNITSYEVV